MKWDVTHEEHSFKSQITLNLHLCIYAELKKLPMQRGLLQMKWKFIESRDYIVGYEFRSNPLSQEKQC